MILSYLYCQQPVLQVIHQALVVILSSSQSPGGGNQEHQHRLHCERLTFFVAPCFSSPSLDAGTTFPREPLSLAEPSRAERLTVTALRGEVRRTARARRAAAKVPNYWSAVTLLECFDKLSGRSSEPLSPFFRLHRGGGLHSLCRVSTQWPACRPTLGSAVNNK